MDTLRFRSMPLTSYRTTQTIWWTSSTNPKSKRQGFWYNTKITPFKINYQINTTKFIYLIKKKNTAASTPKQLLWDNCWQPWKLKAQTDNENVLLQKNNKRFYHQDTCCKCAPLFDGEFLKQYFMVSCQLLYIPHENMVKIFDI